MHSPLSPVFVFFVQETRNVAFSLECSGSSSASALRSRLKPPNSRVCLLIWPASSPASLPCILRTAGLEQAGVRTCRDGSG